MTVENAMTSKVFWPAMELCLLKTMIFIHMVSSGFFSCGRTKKLFPL